MQESEYANVIRFGVFDVDLRSGELRKSGSKISLQEQPFKVLTALLEHPGEVITRDELRGFIWREESFGDFDHALNVAIAKLRNALGDSAEVPRYVETLRHRGYRFIFPLVESRGPEVRSAAKDPGRRDYSIGESQVDLERLSGDLAAAIDRGAAQESD
jgi:DNA-binding winged helix-turn-helix (wHTH) protein